MVSKASTHVSKAEEQVKALRDELAASKPHLHDLQSELEAVQAAVSKANKHAAKAKEQVEALRAELAVASKPLLWPPSSMTNMPSGTRKLQSTSVPTTSLTNMLSDSVRIANAYCACAESKCTSCASMIQSLLPDGSPAKTISGALNGSLTMMSTVNAIKGVHQVMTTWTGHCSSAGQCNFGQFLGM